jgi:hypothetical protein
MEMASLPDAAHDRSAELEASSGHSNSAYVTDQGNPQGYYGEPSSGYDPHSTSYDPSGYAPGVSGGYPPSGYSGYPSSAYPPSSAGYAPSVGYGGYAGSSTAKSVSVRGHHVVHILYISCGAALI